MDALEYEDMIDERRLKDDKTELFLSCQRLWKKEEEFVADRNQAILVSRKDAEASKALRIIRRLLKSYAGHDNLPIRRELHSLNVLKDKLLPMIQRHHGDRCVKSTSSHEFTRYASRSCCCFPVSPTLFFCRL